MYQPPHPNPLSHVTIAQLRHLLGNNSDHLLARISGNLSRRPPNLPLIRPGINGDPTPRAVSCYVKHLTGSWQISQNRSVDDLAWWRTGSLIFSALVCVYCEPVCRSVAHRDTIPLRTIFLIRYSIIILLLLLFFIIINIYLFPIFIPAGLLECWGNSKWPW